MNEISPTGIEINCLCVMQPIAELEAAPTEDKAYQEGGK